MSVWERRIDDLEDVVVLDAPDAADVDLELSTPVVEPARLRISLRHRLFLLDVLVLTAVWGSVLLLPTFRPVDVLATVAAVAAGFLCARAQGLYTTWVNSMRVVVLSRIMWTAAVAGFAVWVTYLWRDYGRGDASTAVIGAFFTVGAMALGRTLFDRWLGRHRSEDRFCREVLLVGDAVDVDVLNSFLADHRELGYRVVGWAGPDDGTGDPARLGDVADSLACIRESGASGALVLSAGLNRTEVNDVTRELVDSGVHVHVWSGLAGINYRRLVTVPVGREPFVHVAPLTISRPQLVGKRVTDIVLASLALLVLSPVLVVSALLIKKHDRGPVFFKQIRVGQHGREIVVHKLRTMVVDAEAKLADLQADNARSGPLFKMARDPRITPIGHFLRRTSIDELPQLIDVLRGDLSLVGPRPALPAEVAQFDDQLLGRLKVRPGITGLWQVEGRDKPSFDVYRRLDLFYVENWSLALDIAILLDSVPAVLGRGLHGSDDDAA
jgi:exopolysaccharide biosynthesis polyprenyl glycosylphosphotransferase